MQHALVNQRKIWNESKMHRQIEIPIYDIPVINRIIYMIFCLFFTI